MKIRRPIKDIYQKSLTSTLNISSW